MEYLAGITGIAALGILSWQDFRSRKIAWWLLPVIAGTLLADALKRNSAAETGKEFLFNIIFLCFQFLLVWIWFSIKNKKRSRIIDTQIGMGDILFMVCLALAFSPANFLVFYTLGMIFTLLATVFVRMIYSTVKSEIPLAGALAIPLIGLCCWRLFDPSKNFYSDAWLMDLLEYNV